MPGRVLQVHAKPQTPDRNGLPKPAVPALEVGALGARGDYNNWRTREVPGDTDQAILLLTTEVIEALNREGWPVKPGDFGENITLTGVTEASLRPGVRLRVGEVVLEVSKACDPCTQLYALPYVGKEKGPAFVRTTHGRRGWFARVILPGRVAAGAPAEMVTSVQASSRPRT
jgi:MOSC domain-containing protein YiiM